MSEADQSWAAASCAALLHQGRAVHWTALVIFLPACAYTIAHPAAMSGLALLCAFMALLTETYFAIRTGIDALLFDRLSNDARGLTQAMADLDRGLEIAELAQANQMRPLGDRIAGAKRLWRNQIIAALFVAMPSLAIMVRGVLT